MIEIFVVSRRARRDNPAMRWVGLVTAVGLVFASANAEADRPRSPVVSAGADAGMIAHANDAAPLETGLLGYFARLSWEREPPAYTTAPKGYIWDGAIVPDVGFSRTWSSESERFTSAAVGLRADLLFSQRRMGLLEVSARGGFWLAARAGFAVLDPPRDVGGVGGEIVPLSADVAETVGLRRNAEGMIYDFAFGAHFALGKSKLRFEYELDVFLLEESLAEDSGGFRLRVGFGAYF